MNLVVLLDYEVLFLCQNLSMLISNVIPMETKYISISERDILDAIREVEENELLPLSELRTVYTDAESTTVSRQDS